MTPGEDMQSGLVPSQSAAFARVGAKSLAVRGHKELRMREEAEGWLSRGLEHRRTRQYDKAFECFDRGLEIGPEDPTLRLCFAEHYYWGYGVPRDRLKATYWFRHPAERGHVIAQSLLADLYQHGTSVTRDLEQSVYWYRKSAEQGLSRSQSALAEAVSLPVSSNELDFWRRKIEEGEHLTDASFLVPLDQNGQGMPDDMRDDMKEALDWYGRAVEQRKGEAQFLLWQLYFSC